MSKKPSIDEIFDKFEDEAKVDFFNNDRFVGFDVSWAMKGIGFGHLTYSYDKVDKCQRADTECMNEEMIEKILKMVAPDMAKKLVEMDKENPPYSGIGDENDS